MTYTIKKLAKLAGISVRTLHYYDEIGLLRPSFTKTNGYRYYQEQEVLKLQQILFFKELEFPLNDIIHMMNSKDFNYLDALKEQRLLLEYKKIRLNNLLGTINSSITNLIEGKQLMTNDHLFTALADKQLEEYKQEAKKRWGHTDAYKQSTERTKHWTKQDYANATRGWKKFTQELADTMAEGYDSPQFQALIAKQHQSIHNFYDCSLDMFRSLGNMYTEDYRFKKNYDKFRPGLAEFMKKAINFYCDHQSNQLPKQ